MGQYPLLQTKLHVPPIRPELVSRSRLVERLNEGLGTRGAFPRALTLISAPAGFGKTTLVSEWVENLRLDATAGRGPAYRVAWLSLDEGDDAPGRFLAYLVTALVEAGGTEATIGRGALAMLQSPQPPPAEAILTSLLNEMAVLPDRFILVLDDYHLIQAQQIHDALTFLLEHLPLPPGGMHLVIITREDPPLSLARLRSRGQLTELRASDLRFSVSEAAEYLNQAMGLGLSPDDVAALETRTEGWIAGLQLAALALRGLALQGTVSMQGREDSTSLIQSFTGSHRFVSDYLVEEVLQQQPEGVQRFLLQTSILDRLAGSLCDAVRFGITKSPSSSSGTAVRFGITKSPSSSSGTAVRFGYAETPTVQSNGQAILEMLEQANLFIVPLDDERRWYRYHHLFAELLRRRLHLTEPECLSILHGRASEWYEQNGFVDEAIDHALRGGYSERAACLIEDHFASTYETGDEASLRRWLSELPEELVFSRPHLCTLYGWNLFTGGQLDAAAQSLRAAEKLLDPGREQEPGSSPDPYRLSGTSRQALAGRVAAIQSFLASYSGDMPGAIQRADQALGYLPDEELEWRSAAFLTLGDAYASQGQMAAAHQARSDALALGRASGDTYYLMIVNLAIAEILRQQGKLQQVIDICERQKKSADKSGISETVVAGWLFGTWGEVLAEVNDLDKAMALATKGVELAARGWDVMYRAMSSLCLARVLFSCGDLAGAEDVLQSLEDSAREREFPHSALRQLSAWSGRIWLAQGRLELASQWARERGLDPGAEPTYRHEMEYVVLARILIAQGRLEDADRLLQRLLGAAEAGGRTLSVIELLILQSLAAQSSGDSAQAMSALEQALTLAQPGGFVRIFVDEGPPMGRLLYAAAARGIAPDYVQRLLVAFPTTEPQPAGPSEPRVSSSELVEPLSGRELEVLQLIAGGLTNPEIAARLYLSLNTVKSHTHNIYGKLGVRNRTQAVARARALGVLPSG